MTIEYPRKLIILTKENKLLKQKYQDDLFIDDVKLIIQGFIDGNSETEFNISSLLSLFQERTLFPGQVNYQTIQRCLYSCDDFAVIYNDGTEENIQNVRENGKKAVYTKDGKKRIVVSYRSKASPLTFAINYEPPSKQDHRKILGIQAREDYIERASMRVPHTLNHHHYERKF